MENKLSEIGNNNLIMNYKKTDDIFADMQELIETTQRTARSTINTLLVQRNWLIGYRIAEEELADTERAENYGLNIMKKLSERLTNAYGKDLQKQIFIVFIRFTRCFQTFSTR